MHFLDNTTIRGRLGLALGLVLVLFVAYGMYSLGTMNRIGESVTKLYEHPLVVSNAALRARMGVIQMHRSMQDIALAQTDPEFREAIKTVQKEEDAVFENLNLIRERILGFEGKKQEQHVRELFTGWKPYRDQAIALVAVGDRDAALLATKDNERDYVNPLERDINGLASYAIRKADGFHSQALEQQSNIFFFTLGFILVGTVLVALMLIAVRKSIGSNLEALRNAMSDILETGKFKTAEIPGKNEITELADQFNLLIVKLRDQFWLREGLNTLNRELSEEFSLSELASHGLNNIAHRVEACAGVLYRFNAEESVCELQASYAYVERKFLSNRFALGEGVVGQAALEKSPILLKNISREEVEGATGTVSEPPKNVYTLPLLYEDRLYGVLEVASFNNLDQVTREFLDEGGKALAVALHSAAQGDRIGELLETTQKTNEELVARSQELDRMNEEMNAANEELITTNQELETKSRELEAQTEELRFQQSELEAKRTQVEEADRLKSEFLSNMSHELRTPLNSVLTLSQLMLKRGTGKDQEKEAEYLKVIERNGRHLLSLINNILDLSKIEAGKVEVYKTTFSAGKILEDILSSLRPMAEKKGIELRFMGGNALTLHSDMEKVRQVLLNLVSNAVKFTDKGWVEAGVTQKDGLAVFSVQDTGIGLSVKEKEYIFDEFRQADGSTTRRYEGTGLGLAISRKLARVLEGEISVKSDPGQGSLFTFYLPARISDQTVVSATPLLPVGPEERATERIMPNRATVLVVDDEEGSRRLLKGHLESVGYNVVTAENGRTGLRLAKEIQPFAITLDILMPNTDGWEVIRELKETEETREIPVIMVSVSSDKATGMALGAAGYVVKPVDPEALLRELRKVGLQRKVQRILAVDDDPAVVEMLEEFLTERGYTVKTASGGKEALDMVAADPPDAMIMDLMMPEVDGFTVLERLRAQGTGSNLPCIVLTAKDINQEERTRLQISASSILQKGATDRSGLLNQIEGQLEELWLSRREDRPLVLLVEDNEVAAMQVQVALREEGYAVFRASGGENAYEFLERERPDAIILDLMMPGIDGFSVLERLRSKPETVNIPVLVLTAKDVTAEERSRLSASNVLFLLQKGSINRDQLMDHLKDLVAGPEIPEFLPIEEPPLPTVLKRQGPILVVEDNPDNLVSITALLEEAGYEFTTAASGEQAIAKSKENSPALVLMDIELPEVSGLEVTKAFKADPELADIPVVALTARAMRGDREDILAAGCDGYLSKPIEPPELEAVLKKWVGREE